MAGGTEAGGSRVGGALLLVLRLLWTAFVIATPLLGVWTASSLATYLNGPVALAVASGFLLFPGLPLLWDALANHRRASLLSRRREARERQGLAFEPPRRILTFGDRLILRTLVVNGACLGGLVAAYPEAGFAALSTRGDWMLEGRRDATSEQLRARLLQGASMLQWAYELAHDNPYREAEVDPPPPSGTRGGQLPELPAEPEPAPQPDAPDAGVPEAVAEGGDALPEAPAEEARAEPAVERKRGWPLPATLHPAVVALPKEQEGSIESVAAHLAAEERDPYFLVKALHDYVADRIVYDVPAYRSGDIPPQDAETTFRTRKSVCAGYAKLLRALGKAAGVEIRYVPGDARHSGWEVTGEPHAWNAVEIDGEWYLIDATWNAGGVGDDGFTKGVHDDLPLHAAGGIRHQPSSR